MTLQRAWFSLLLLSTLLLGTLAVFAAGLSSTIPGRPDVPAAIRATHR